MDPKETGKNYDAMASWWLEQMKESTYGVAALERALKFVEKRCHALDVGCGCEGRFIRILQKCGFQCAGLDISEAMVALATTRYPDADFSAGDICSWQLPRKYDLITAWDSTFHLPLESHEPVLLKLCDGLSKNGVILFSCAVVKNGGTFKVNLVESDLNIARWGFPSLSGSSGVLAVLFNILNMTNTRRTMSILSPRRLSDDSRLVVECEPWPRKP